MKKILIGILIVIALVFCGLKFFPPNNQLAATESSKNSTSQNSETKSLKPKQIIFIRHGEKENSDGRIQKADLSSNGYKRANELPDFFKNHLPANISKPDVIIAMKQKTSKNSNRPFETVEPLSKALNIPIIANYKKTEIGQAVEDINKFGENKVVLVCWEHQNIVKMAQLLGAPVNSWGYNPQAQKDNKNYDAIWVITKIDDTKAELAVYKEFSVLDNGEISYGGVSNLPLYKQEFQYQ
ncbi:phosphoglycerate mutase family protein [Desulfosporosinus sp. PR]|uniref:phosphoglycerate mutase family protein n=1 Tax=Candidatus Desulfosporosinus nitrosoreducens TaxID=3401928 RepID=UPI0027FBE9F1|nr:phosphoglycerate mutase family protein [Desulfosporosinus sp. PR]MDQ7094477.1 phosphoglycerate mutase family protein [Desulfosporosinus sp. PR]